MPHHRSRPRRKRTVNDDLGSVGVSTNGLRRVDDAETSRPIPDGPETIGVQSVDERLEALMETIRTWDWRAAAVESGPPRVDEEMSAASVIAATAERPEDYEPTAYRPPPVEGAQESHSGLLEPMPRTIDAPSKPAEASVDARYRRTRADSRSLHGTSVTSGTNH